MKTALSKAATKLAFAIHGWIGLAAGIFFLLFGLTGSALMFRHEIDRKVNDQFHQLSTSGASVSIDSIYRGLANKYPNLKKIVLHDFPTYEGDSYEFMLYKNQQKVSDGYLYYVFIDPHGGTIVGEGGYDEPSPSFMRWLYQFHYSLQLGMPGKLFSAIVGLVMVLSLLSGTIVYRKHLWDALKLKGLSKLKSRKNVSSWLHRVIGTWSLLLNAVLFFTGFWMNKDFFLTSAWKISAPTINQVAATNMDSVVSKAQKIRGFTPIAVTMPTMDGQPILVRGHFQTTTGILLQGKASSLSFDAHTGELLQVTDIVKKSFSDRLEWQIYQLHIGAFGGLAAKAIYVFVGITPGLLAITGTILWLRRNRRLTVKRWHKRNSPNSPT